MIKMLVSCSRLLTKNDRNGSAELEIHLLLIFVFTNKFSTEKACDEKNMSDNWEIILDVCDKVKAITTGPKDCLKAIYKRMSHPNPHVAKQAVNVSSTTSIPMRIVVDFKPPPSFL